MAQLQAAKRAIRDPRLLVAGFIVAGIAVLAVVFGGGWTPGGLASAPTASPTLAVVTPPPGVASMTISGGVTGAFSLTGTVGFGRPSNDQLASTWTDARGGTLTLTGLASSGTRPTGPDLGVTWAMVVGGTTVTFTSQGGECVVGMAVQPTAVVGSITCHALTSADGTVVIDVEGTYHT